MQNKTLHRFSEIDWDALIGKVYDAGLHPQQWGDVLSSIGRPINAHAGQLVVLSNNVSDVYENILFGLEPASTVKQFEELLQRGLHIRANHGSLIPEMTTITDYVHSDESSMKQHPFYQEHAIPLDIPYYGATVVKKSSDTFIASVMLRSKRYGHLTADEIAYLNRLGPHIRRSIELSTRLPAEGVVDGAMSVIGKLACGAVLINSRLRISAMNDTALRYLAENDGVVDTSGVLAITDKDTAKQLTNELKQGLGIHSSAAVTGSGLISARRPSGKTHYTIIVTPLRTSQEAFRQRYCVVLIIDPEAGFELPQDILKEEYGLTSAECSVVTLLVAGHSLSKIAKIRRCSIETVRSHEKSAMAKTRTSRQAELVSKLLKSFAALIKINVAR